MIAIEGNTRLYYLCKSGIDSLFGLIVRGVVSPLPGQPVDPCKALLSTFGLQPDKRIREFRYENFRSIEGAVRS